MTHVDVANDLAVQAKFFAKRDAEVASVCRECAWLINSRLAGAVVGPEWYDRVERPMQRLTRRFFSGTRIHKSLMAGLQAIAELQNEDQQ